MVLSYLGCAYQQRGEFTKATAAYEKALATVNRDGKHGTQYAVSLAALASLYAEIDQTDTAKRLLLRSVHLFESQGDHLNAAMIWNDLATMAAENQSRGEAHKYMKQSIAESQLATIHPVELAALTTTQGRIAQLDGDARTAVADYQRALVLCQQTREAQAQRTAWLHILLADAYLQADDVANARDEATRGLALLQATSGSQTPLFFLAQLTYSKILDASGLHKEASAVRQQAQAALDTNTDRRRAESQISVNALR
jgi:tetratricopeptide (TPR) repeat protein